MNKIKNTGATTSRVGAVPDRLDDAILAVTHPEKCFEDGTYQSVENRILHLRTLAEAADVAADNLAADIPGAITAIAFGFAEKNPPGTLAYMIRTVDSNPRYKGGSFEQYSPFDTHWSAVGATWGGDHIQCTNVGVYRFLGLNAERDGIFIPVAVEHVS